MFCQIDGRAENLKANLKRDIAPMTETLDGIKHFDNIDVESYLGFGSRAKPTLEIFRQAVKGHSYTLSLVFKILERA